MATLTLAQAQATGTPSTGVAKPTLSLAQIQGGPSPQPVLPGQQPVAPTTPAPVLPPAAPTSAFSTATGVTPQAPAAPTAFAPSNLAKIPGQIAGGLKTLFGGLASNEVNAGQDIAAALPANTNGIADINKANQGGAQSDVAFITAMNALKKSGKPLTTQQQTMYDNILQTHSTTVNPTDVLPSLGKTSAEVAGDFGGVALDAATAGTISKSAQSLKLLKAAAPVAEAAKAVEPALGTGAKLAQIGKNYLKSSAALGAIGYGYDTTSNLQQGKTGAAAIAPGVGTAAGLALPAASAILKAGATIAKGQAPKIVNSLVKPLLKDFSYGKDPGRAIAAEGITGNSLEGLAKNITTRRQEIGQEIGDLSTHLDVVTQGTGSGGRGPLQIGDSLKPIDDAMQDAAKTNNGTLLSRLQSVKDALTHDLTLGEKDGAPTIEKGTAKDLDNTTYQQAFDMKKQIGNMTRWTGNQSDDQSVNGALKQVYGKVKEAMNTAADKENPEVAARLKSLNERYADLTTAEVATKYRDKIDSRQNLISAPIKAGAIAGLLAAPFTGGLSLTTALVGVGAAGLDKALGSTAVKTRVASWLAKESPTVVDKFYAQHPDIANVIYKTFSEEHSVGDAKLPTLPVPRGMVRIPGTGATDPAKLAKNMDAGDLKTARNFLDASDGKASAPEAYINAGTKMDTLLKNMNVNPATFKTDQAKVDFVAALRDHHEADTTARNVLPKAKTQGRQVDGKFDTKK